MPEGGPAASFSSCHHISHGIPFLQRDL